VDLPCSPVDVSCAEDESSTARLPFPLEIKSDIDIRERLLGLGDTGELRGLRADRSDIGEARSEDETAEGGGGEAENVEIREAEVGAEADTGSDGGVGNPG
jgi:hypothetical protein